MKKRLLIPLFALLLSGCKTNDLYKRNLYNSPNFDENYYTIYDNFGDENNFDKQGDVVIVPTKVDNLGHANLGADYKAFKNGILSKLYDGRTECGGLYQLSRVQVDKSGFGTKLPNVLNGVEKFEFAARGGSTCPSPLFQILHYNIEIKLVDLGSETIYSYKINNLSLPTDMGGETYIYSFDLGNQINVSYYSFKFNCVDLPENVSDDYTVEESQHLSIMLYEVLMYKSEPK